MKNLREERGGFDCCVSSEIVIYLQHLFSLRDIIEIDRGVMYFVFVTRSRFQVFLKCKNKRLCPDHQLAKQSAVY